MIDKQQFELLLPWYVNNTLDEKQHSSMDAYLKDHPELEGKIQELNTIKTSYVQHIEKSVNPSEFALARLHKRMSDGEQTRSQKPPYLQQNNSKWWKVGMAASLFLLASQSFVMMNNNKNDYQVLSGSHLSTTGETWQIRFKENVTEFQMRQLLQNTKFVIVDGPSLIGVYHIKTVSSDPLLLAKLQSSSLLEDVNKD